jgi:VWFA-related protein
LGGHFHFLAFARHHVNSAGRHSNTKAARDAARRIRVVEEELQPTVVYGRVSGKIARVSWVCRECYRREVDLDFVCFFQTLRESIFESQFERHELASKPGGFFSLQSPRTLKLLLHLVLPLVWAFTNGASASFAQASSAVPPDQSAPIKVQTTLVMIPTVVLDKHGKHVDGLKEEDFVVRKDGKPQKIGLFSHVQTKAEVMQAAAAPPNTITNQVEGKSDRLTIFVMDFMNTAFLEQKETRDQLLKFLSKSIDTKEPICLIAIDQTGVRLIHDFTTDPAILVEALKNLKQQHSSRDEPEKNPIEETFRMAQGWHAKGNAGIAGAINRLETLKLANAVQSQEQGYGIGFTLEALREISEAFVGIPGRKSMIWATAGIPFELDDVSSFKVHNRTMLPAYERTWRALNRANIAVYPLDVERLVNPGYVDPGVGHPLPQHGPLQTNLANMERFAEVTGGQFCDRSKDAESCFHEAVNDSSDYYLIGIYETAEDAKPGWHKLSVKLLRPDVQVRARTGYYVGEEQDKGKQVQEEMELALTSPIDYSGVPLTVKWSPVKESATPGKKKVEFLFALPPGTATIDAEHGNHISLEFAALAKSGTGAPQQTFSKGVEGDLSAATLEQVRKKGVTMPGQLELGPGEYTLTFVVRDALSHQIGSVTAFLNIP